VRGAIQPLLPPPPAAFIAEFPDRVQVELLYQELIGVYTYVYGAYESPELDVLRRRAEPGSTVFDVGGHAGIFALSLARAVGSSGFVVSFEPLPANAERIEANAQRCGISNIQVKRVASGSSSGTVRFTAAKDPALGHLARSTDSGDPTIEVEMTTLDETWEELGRPRVSVVKIDAEGAELDVVAGAHELIERESPLILVETNEIENLMQLERQLAVRYTVSQPAGFAPFNHLLEPR
jgi:FkbM family methyltransferase